jgi:hypothetical protein
VRDGNLVIFKAGTTLTATWIERLKNFARTRRLEEMVDVRVPTCGHFYQSESVAQGIEK